MSRRLIKTDGTIVEYAEPVSFEKIKKLIGAQWGDIVNLRTPDRQIMVVDDEGYDTTPVVHAPGHIELKCTRNRKPFNDEATKLYHNVCVPGTTHRIVGDVFIALDSDFGE